MYDRTYGTDWTELDRAEAIERAFALGVADACDEGDPEEFSRIKNEGETAYDRSLIQLAYDEGRTKALDASVEGSEKVWEELVDDAGTPRAAPLPAAFPGALSDLTVLRKRDDGLPSSLNLPSMLRK